MAGNSRDLIAHQAKQDGKKMLIKNEDVDSLDTLSIGSMFVNYRQPL